MLALVHLIAALRLVAPTLDSPVPIQDQETPPEEEAPASAVPS